MQNVFYWAVLLVLHSLSMRWAGGAQCPVWRVNEPKKTGARSARACMRGQNLLVINNRLMGLSHDKDLAFDDMYGQF